MSEAKHTPGPWFATPTSGTYGHVSSANTAVPDENGDIATTWGMKGCAKANARLIAAAPDMLEVLRTTAGNIRSLGPAGALPSPYQPWLDAVDAAIAKAEGR